MRRFALLLVVLLVVSVIPAHAQDDIPNTDGIPANCESSSPYADPNLFPRYANGQLALIDWSSGETVRVLETDSAAPNFWLLGWSPDCHYLAGGLGDGLRYTTILWDATNGAQIGTVADGYRRPHFLTWSPRGDALVVETRHGAFLWDLATGNRLQLTITSYNARSFAQIEWNYAAGTLDTLNLFYRPIIFRLDTGRPTNLTLAEDEYPGGFFGTVTAPNDRSPYVCGEVYLPNISFRVSEDRLLLRDDFTSETLQVLDSDFAQAVSRGGASGTLSPNCEFYLALLYMGPERQRRLGVVLRLSDGARLHTFSNLPRYWSTEFGDSRWTWRWWNQQWDATGRYLLVQTHDGAQVWDSATDFTFYVTTAAESQWYGYSVDSFTWDLANGRVTVEMLRSDEVRVFDLATGQRVE
ncbi:MAG: WD40 repeat domain-containing protein [Chloroflexi bacterium]|uniref:WD40 repeat domain-containing protein n=1 Tax=Candidatus Flexifilum breve TaxID=3140694 RepID=UPI00313594BA|nr:WD40 repeat domain-containing protein [Chloroflexota bacterium]